MHAGRIVEEGPRSAVIRGPAHPYTRGLLASRAGEANATRLDAIPGSPPDPSRQPPGCAFAPRCGWSADPCRDAVPPPLPAGESHWARCVRLEEIG